MAGHFDISPPDPRTSLILGRMQQFEEPFVHLRTQQDKNELRIVINPTKGHLSFQESALSSQSAHYSYVVLCL